ncbi:TPA: hypothetical protein NJ328_003219 [Vibrio parahaemolyticus]|uniref:Uncharacterized protein n=2 Tax=Vibrio TaxID=662 RepID=A0AA47JDV8_VIBPH|nr:MULTISPECIES: hypothetical protein [Vibrio]EIE1275530.1 hypothetical protein [Vibrio parahaemolyticus]ELA8113462.1 hypothetical protein [Vibrio parahaemolyticus]ELA8167136.1 hypothetical protein [Vibrio parahaemolyticus]ELA9461223.1 hypothetical protein [Vibrio alginolyticus]MBS9848533.1 hypothetical protein [Vibrio alginolyticus]
MTERENNQYLNIGVESAPIQTHLGIIQNVIQRMAANSSACKAWCVTLVSAILVIVADKGKPDFTYIAFLPTAVFLALDAYYLALEKAFRQSYNDFVKKLHEEKLTQEDLYSVLPKGNLSSLQIQSLKSFSVWGFYISIVVLIYITKIIAIG